MEAVYPTFEEARNYVVGELGVVSSHRLRRAYDEVIDWASQGLIRRAKPVILVNILTLAETEIGHTSKSDVKPRWTTTSSGPARVR